MRAPYLLMAAGALGLVAAIAFAESPTQSYVASRGVTDASITSGSTSIVLKTGQGARFPTDYPYRVTIHGSGGTDLAIVTNISGDTLTVTRAGTSHGHNAGALVHRTVKLWMPDPGLVNDGTSVTTATVATLDDVAAMGGGPGGGVTGPASSTDNAICRWDGTGGTAIQNSEPTIDDSGNISMGSGDTVDGRDVSADGATLDNIKAAPIVTMEANATLTNERYLAVTSPLTKSDGGAGAAVTLALSTTATLSNQARVGVRINSAGSTYTRRRINVIPGSANMTASHSDDSTDEEIDLTLNAVPTGSEKEIQYRNAGAFGGATNATIESSNLAIGETSAPSAVTNKLILAAVARARQNLWGTPELGPAYAIGPAPWMYGHRTRVTPNNSGNPSTDGIAVTVSANTAAAPSSTNRITSAVRIAATTATGDNAGLWTFQTSGSPMFWRGNGAGLGGFHYSIRVSPQLIPSGSWLFIGLVDTIYAGTADPLAGTPTRNLIGFGYARGGSGGNLKIAHDANSGTVTTVDLGASFAIGTGALWDLHLFADQNASTVLYFAEDLISGATAAGTLSTNLPANTVFMRAVAQMGNGANTPDSGCQLDWLGAYLEAFGG